MAVKGGKTEPTSLCSKRLSDAEIVGEGFKIGLDLFEKNSENIRVS